MQLPYKRIALAACVLCPLATNAHTDLTSHPGMLANVIALGIVLLAIIVFLVIDRVNPWYLEHKAVMTWICKSLNIIYLRKRIIGKRRKNKKGNARR